MKNKTTAAWLAFIAGPLGLHRFYLYGKSDLIGWLLPIPTALGIFGIERVTQNGIDDMLSWILVPMLGFTFAGCALTAIVYGLTSSTKWNIRFNPVGEQDATAGTTNWLTIGAVITALLIGTTVLMASITFSIQRYFEFQVEDVRSISR